MGTVWWDSEGMTNTAIKLKSTIDTVSSPLDTAERQICEIFSKLLRQKMGKWK